MDVLRTYSSSSTVQFINASEYGHGTVSYLRKQAPQVEWASAGAWSRTAPLQCVSKPKFELQTAPAAVRPHRLLEKKVDMAILSTDFWDDSNVALQPHWQLETQVEGLGSKSRCRDGNQVSTKSEKLPEHFNPATDASRDLPAQGLYKAGEGGSKAQPSWWSPSKSGLPLTYLRCKKTMQKSRLRRVLFMPTEQRNCKSEAAPPEILILVCSTAGARTLNFKEVPLQSHCQGRQKRRLKAFNLHYRRFGRNSASYSETNWQASFDFIHD